MPDRSSALLPVVAANRRVNLTSGDRHSGALSR